MITMLSWMSLLGPLAVMAVLVWAFVRTRNVGFIVLATGTSVLGIIFRLMAPSMHSMVFRMTRSTGVRAGDLLAMFSLGVGVVEAIIVGVGIVLIVRGMSRPAEQRPDADDQLPSHGPL